MKYRFYGRTTALVILVSFLMNPVYGEAPTVILNDSGNGGMRFYSDIEVAELAAELSEAAEAAIEGAAAEAAKAATLAALDREGAVRREAAAALAMARQWEQQYREVKTERMKRTVITGLICFVAGAALCSGIIAIYGGR